MPLQIGTVTSQNIPSAQKPPSFADVLTRFMPAGNAPIYLLLSKMGEGKCTQITHGYWTEEVPFGAFTVTEPLDDVATTATVADTSKIMKNTIFRNQLTGEIVRVEAIINATTFTIRRNIGGLSPAPSVADNQVFYQVGSAHQEGSTRPASARITQTLVNNTTHIFRNAWSITGTAKELMYYNQAGGNPMAKDKREAAAFHAMDIETAIWFSWASAFTDSNGDHVHTMDGIQAQQEKYAPSNEVAGSGVDGEISLAALEAGIELSFNKKSNWQTTNSRILFCGSSLYTAVNNLGRLNGTYQLMHGQTDFGLQFSTFRTARGQFMLMEHPLFNSNTDWQRMGFSIDMNVLKLMYLGSRKAIYEEWGADGKKSTDNSIDAQGGVYTSELTLENRNPHAHITLTNMAKAIANP